MILASPCLALPLLLSPAPQEMLVADASGISYTPPERTLPDTPYHTLSVFLPKGAPPAEGWPVLLWNMSGGFVSAVAVNRLHPSQEEHRIPYGCLQAGIAVISYGVTGATQRNGQFHAPGDPSGNYEDPDYDMPEKCAVWAIQWAREHGVNLFPLDMDRAGHAGSSAGASLGLWSALGPDRAFASGSSFVQQSTRLAFVVANRAWHWVPAHSDVTRSVGIRHFARAEDGGPASRIDQIAPEDLRAISPALYMLAPDSNAAQTAVYTAFDEPVGSNSYGTDAEGLPVLEGALRDVHDSWHAYMRQQELERIDPVFHGANSRLAIANGLESTAGTLRGLEDFTWTGDTFSQALADDCVAWIEERVNAAPAPDPDPTTPPQASFSAASTSGVAPLTVAFTDLSSGAPTSWAWDFGDGATSSGADPTHTYTSPGTYSVSLAVSNLDGSDTVTQLDLVRVDAATTGGVTLYGCGVNPPGSLVHVSGAATLGSTLVFGLDNPLGTQAPGATATLFLSNEPNPAFPCGSLVPGTGMSEPGAAGEALVRLGPNLVETFSGPAWPGPGDPSLISVTLGEDAALLGATFYVQGLLYDPSGAFGVTRGLTEAAEITVGP